MELAITFCAPYLKAMDVYEMGNEVCLPVTHSSEYVNMALSSLWHFLEHGFTKLLGF